MPEDNWKHRGAGLRCSTCMWYVPKDMSDLGRCRRHAPSMNGFVPVFSSDWCGDHRLNDRLFTKKSVDLDGADSTLTTLDEIIEGKHPEITGRR